MLNSTREPFMNKLRTMAIIASTVLISHTAAATVPINGTVQSKCVITTDTDGVYGNPNAYTLSTDPSDGGVKPRIRYDIVTANAYHATVTYPNQFSQSPTLSDTVTWTGSVVVGDSSDAGMSAFESGKITYNNVTEFDLSIAGSVWFDVTSTASYGVNKALPAGNYSATVTAECIAQ